MPAGSASPVARMWESEVGRRLAPAKCCDAASAVPRTNPKTGQRHLDAIHWGFVLPWIKTAVEADEIGRRLFNARTDMLAERALFAKPRDVSKTSWAFIGCATSSTRS